MAAADSSDSDHKAGVRFSFNKHGTAFQATPPEQTQATMNLSMKFVAGPEPA